MNIPINEFGVPYYRYTLTIEDGRKVDMDIGCEDDWGNVQRCVRDGKICVGWGSADEWKKVVSVYECEADTYRDPLQWAREDVWPFAYKYAGEL